MKAKYLGMSAFWISLTILCYTNKESNLIPITIGFAAYNFYKLFED